MKTLFVSLIVMMTASSAMADGFVCETLDGSLNIKAYNHTAPEAGTRTGAILVLSDPAVQSGRKTIARFEDVEGNLSSSGAEYVANVDLRFANSGRKGELILGTKLGQLDQVILDLDYVYNHVSKDGEEVKGSLLLVKRNGDRIVSLVECARYLKNQ
jgi:hypothetical protein